jgi:hypothetical protein
MHVLDGGSELLGADPWPDSPGEVIRVHECQSGRGTGNKRPVHPNEARSRCYEHVQNSEWFLDQVPDLREILTLRLAPGCGAEEPRAC